LKFVSSENFIHRTDLFAFNNTGFSAQARFKGYFQPVYETSPEPECESDKADERRKSMFISFFSDQAGRLSGELLG